MEKDKKCGGHKKVLGESFSKGIHPRGVLSGGEKAVIQEEKNKNRRRGKIEENLEERSHA